MKKILLFCLMTSGLLSTKAQAFTQGFENLPLTDWTYINNGSTEPNEQWGFWSGYNAMTPHSGTLMAGIQYSDNGPHNDYLVTRMFAVIPGVSDKFSFYAQNYSSNFQENFSVLVSEGAPVAAEFTGTLVANLAPSTGTWTKYEYDLTPYIGKDIYIAFHSTTNFQWFVAIDDVAASGLTLATDNNSTKNTISAYPNPFSDVLTISDVKNVKSILVSDVSGRIIKNIAVQKEINLSDLKSGLYFVTLKMEDGSTNTIKAIKK